MPNLVLGAGDGDGKKGKDIERVPVLKELRYQWWRKHVKKWIHRRERVENLLYVFPLCCQQSVIESSSTFLYLRLREGWESGILGFQSCLWHLTTFWIWPDHRLDFLSSKMEEIPATLTSKHCYEAQMRSFM